MRVFQLPAILLLFCAFVLTLLTSVSLPYLRTLDITRTHFGERQVTIANEPSDQLRVRTALYYSLRRNAEVTAFGSLVYGEPHPVFVVWGNPVLNQG